MGGNGGCGCGAAGAEPCRCEHPARPPPNGASPPAPTLAHPAPLVPPGLAEAYTRFDLFEEVRRRGFPVASPADPARPPPDAPRARPAVLEPAAHPAADGREIQGPRFDAPAPRTAEDGPVAPEGAPLDVERFFDVASPDGAIVAFEATWPGDIAPRPGASPGAERPPRPEPLQPPEYTSTIGGPEEQRLLDAPPAEEPRPAPRPRPPDPPGFASTEAPQGKEPRAPGQEPCTQDAHIVFPPAEEFLFTPQPPEARGKGGEEEPEPERRYGMAFWTDPCPCKCVCVPIASFLWVFVRAGRLIGSFLDLFKRNRRFLGVTGRPAIVVSTPDGFVEHVRDVVARRDAVAYGTPFPAPPGSAAPLDGLSATFAVRAPAATSTQLLLWPELDGALATEVPAAAPVGPGPGIPGIGTAPLVPSGGASLRASPGSLFAGIAPAGDGFGEWLAR